jgi:hypothetical protein
MPTQLAVLLSRSIDRLIGWALARQLRPERIHVANVVIDGVADVVCTLLVAFTVGMFSL